MIQAILLNLENMIKVEKILKGSLDLIPSHSPSVKIQINVLFTLNRTTRSSVLLLCVVRFNVSKTLPHKFKVFTVSCLFVKYVPS